MQWGLMVPQIWLVVMHKFQAVDRGQQVVEQLLVLPSLLDLCSGCLIWRCMQWIPCFLSLLSPCPFAQDPLPQFLLQELHLGLHHFSFRQFHECHQCLHCLHCLRHHQCPSWKPQPVHTSKSRKLRRTSHRRTLKLSNIVHILCFLLLNGCLFPGNGQLQSTNATGRWWTQIWK